MIYSADDLLSCLQTCWGEETIYVRTPENEGFAVSGFEIDKDGDVILLTEKME